MTNASHRNLQMNGANEMNTATFIKQRNGIGDGRVYRLDPPIPTRDGVSEYVWVSAVSMSNFIETYIFACDEDGEDVQWHELDGSFRGGTDHVEALRRAGYEVAP